MSIEQRLEQIEQNQREILRLLRPDHEPILLAPSRCSERKKQALARAAHYEGLRKKRELRQ